uniref:Endonuclease/exonuclease/phosphatase domain-containing protein n=1 Tax=Fagus sylvatica TaxID=28930 RepID=A0A2N9ENE1_FAGSY
MSCLSLNCRGLGNPETVRDLHDVVRKEGPNIVFLMETRLPVRSLEFIRIRLRMQGCFGVDRHGYGGGLALLWDSSVTVITPFLPPGFSRVSARKTGQPGPGRTNLTGTRRFKMTPGCYPEHLSQSLRRFDQIRPELTKFDQAYLGGSVCVEIPSNPQRLGPRAENLKQEGYFSYNVQLLDRQELFRSSRNLDQKMTPWHKEHSNGLRSQDHILRTQARLCARPVPLENRVFLTRNKLIRKPGHVGKKTHPCTTWNSQDRQEFTGSSQESRSEKSPPTDQKHSGGLCSRGHISQAQARIPANPEPCKIRQRKISDGTKNVEIRHRELGQICARTGTRFEKKRAGSKTRFSSRTAAFARRAFPARNKLIREPVEVNSDDPKMGRDSQ